MNLANWTPAENEFFSEEEMIEISPNFRGNEMKFISGTFGPFRPAKPVNVPLWLAVYLKKRQKCSVQLPYWLDNEYLTKVKAEEREQKEAFSTSIPYYYFEIAQLLLSECQDEFDDHRQTKSLVEDLFDSRREKIIKIMKEIDPDTPVKFLSSAGSAEINYVRPSFTSAYSIVNKMQNVIKESRIQE